MSKLTTYTKVNTLLLAEGYPSEVANNFAHNLNNKFSGWNCRDASYLRDRNSVVYQSLSASGYKIDYYPDSAKRIIFICSD